MLCIHVERLVQINDGDVVGVRKRRNNSKYVWCKDTWKFDRGDGCSSFKDLFKLHTTYCTYTIYVIQFLLI